MRKNDFYVYAHIAKDTKKVFYVGKGRKRRAWIFKQRNKFWKNIAAKHGVEVVILKNCLTEKKAFYLEQRLIGRLGRRDAGSGFLVNMTNGGEGVAGYKPSKETLTKKSQALKGRKFIGVNVKNMQSAYDSGLTLKQVAKKFNVCVGTVLKYIDQDASRKYIPRTAFKKGVAVWNKGDGSYMSGSKNHFYNKHHSEISKRKMSLKKCKKVACVETGAVYKSTIECAEKTGYSQSYVSRSARGERQKIHKQHFKYV